MHRSLQASLVLRFVAQLLVIAGCAGDDAAPAHDAGALDANGGAADAGRGEGGETEDDAGSAVPGGICTSCGSCEQAPRVNSQLHVPTPITYPDPPPVGGDHNPCWHRWGQFEDEVADERWVHNLEHGGVVFLHRCSSGCPDELADLQALAKRSPRTILTPYAALPTRFAVVAWGHRLLSDCLDVAAFQAFYDARFDKAPESIGSEPPTSCN